MSGPRVAHLTRRYRFSASHRLHSPLLSDEANREIYGKCNNPYGHGHNYFLEVTVAGPIDPDTGFVVDLPRLDALIQSEILDRFDHVLLNADTAFAGAFVPSTENLAIVMESVLRREVSLLNSRGGLRLTAIRIEETGRNSVELPAREMLERPPAELQA